MLSKWKKSASTESAQNRSRNHRVDIANRMMRTGPNDTEHRVSFLRSHLSEPGGPLGACFEWDTPTPPSRSPHYRRQPRGCVCIGRRAQPKGRLLLVPKCHKGNTKCNGRIQYNSIKQARNTRYQGNERLTCPLAINGRSQYRGRRYHP